MLKKIAQNKILKEKGGTWLSLGGLSDACDNLVNSGTKKCENSPLF